MGAGGETSGARNAEPEQLPEAQQAAAPRSSGERIEAALLRLFARPRLPAVLVAIALVLAAPALGLGFYIDDWVGRYIYSDLEHADQLYRIYAGGYGLANGNAEDTHWTIEQGFAPWWTWEGLSIRMLRPLPLLTHHFDAWAFPDSALLQHAHNLLWLAALVLAATRLFRGALGPVAGGLAALLFALDHTRGFAVGYIVNRHALVAATFGVLALDQFLRACMHGDARGRVLGPVLYAVALAGGESAVATAGYMGAFALFADRSPLVRRALSLAPYVALTLVWAAIYSSGGYGARGSGLYIDPGSEPLHYLAAFVERAPVLLLGLFAVPPAEVRMVGPAPFGAAIQVLAVLFTLAFAFALVPLLRRQRLARFWAAGIVISLVPAASAFPHNRQLLFASFGGIALIAQLWELHAFELKNAVLSRAMTAARAIAALPLSIHLFASPVIGPIAVCSIALLSPLQRPLADGGAGMAGRTVVFVNAPDYLAVRHVQLEARVEGKPLPRRWRALAFGPEPLIVARTSARTLELHYQGGILSTPFTQLFRDRRQKMAVGERVQLEGLAIEVLAVTPDGRMERARFTFDGDLDAPEFKFYAWVDGRFAPYEPPAIGARHTLAPARMEYSWK